MTLRQTFQVYLDFPLWVGTLEPVHIIDIHFSRHHSKCLGALPQEVLLFHRRGLLGDSEGVGSCSVFTHEATIRRTILDAIFALWQSIRA